MLSYCCNAWPHHADGTAAKLPLDAAPRKASCPVSV